MSVGVARQYLMSAWAANDAYAAAQWARVIWRLVGGAKHHGWLSEPLPLWKDRR